MARLISDVEIRRCIGSYWLVALWRIVGVSSFLLGGLYLYPQMTPCPSRTREINMDMIRVVLVVSIQNSIYPSLSGTSSIYEVYFRIRHGMWWALPNLVYYF